MKEEEREMKVDRTRIECIIVWPEAGESAIGCVVSCNTIAKGPLPPSHAGDIERICRELRKVQSAEKTADKTSEPSGGIGSKGEKGNREMGGRAMNGGWMEGPARAVSVELSSGTLRFYADSPETSRQFRN